VDNAKSEAVHMLFSAHFDGDQLRIRAALAQLEFLATLEELRTVRIEERSAQ
jgi:hypothetical protein